MDWNHSWIGLDWVRQKWTCVQLWSVRRLCRAGGTHHRRHSRSVASHRTHCSACLPRQVSLYTCVGQSVDERFYSVYHGARTLGNMIQTCREEKESNKNKRITSTRLKTRRKRWHGIYNFLHKSPSKRWLRNSASEMTYIVAGGALNSILTH